MSSYLYIYISIVRLLSVQQNILFSVKGKVLLNRKICSTLAISDYTPTLLHNYSMSHNISNTGELDDQWSK